MSIECNNLETSASLAFGPILWWIDRQAKLARLCKGVQKGVVRQILTRLKAPQSHKSMKRRFGTTLWERHCVFAYKSVCFLDVFHDWSGSGLKPWLKRISARFGSSLKHQHGCLAELIQLQIRQSGLLTIQTMPVDIQFNERINVFIKPHNVKFQTLTLCNPPTRVSCHT